MPIEAKLDKTHGPQAQCTCDTCKKETVTLRAKMNNSSAIHMNSNIKNKSLIENMKTVHQQLAKQGWTVKRKLIICPSCASNLNKEIKTVTVKQEVRQPTQKQKRDIALILGEFYDTDKQCYKGDGTDQKVAEYLSDGIMWGWVKQIREDFYGPDGNESDEIAVEEIKTWMASLEVAIKENGNAMIECEKTLKVLEHLKQQGSTMLKRLNNG